MKEPIVVSQTFEQAHVASCVDVRLWFEQQAAEAHKQGVTFCRYSIAADGKGLCFEGWKEQPKDQGEPRWAVAAVPE